MCSKWAQNLAGNIVQSGGPQHHSRSTQHHWLFGLLLERVWAVLIVKIMPKRAFPFDSYSPIQTKIHVNNFHVEKETYMQKIYSKKRWKKIKFICLNESLFVCCSSRVVSSLEIFFYSTEKTTDLLMKASVKIYGAQTDENCPKEQKSALKCQGCGRTNCSDACEFCSMKICSVCSRNCDDCGGKFCGVCSIIK